jgi:hypothetical protein
MHSICVENTVEIYLIFFKSFMLATNQSQPISLWISQSAIPSTRRSYSTAFSQHFHQTYVSPFVDPRILGRAKRRSVFRLLMLPFCQHYKTAPMSQRALISRGRGENYLFDGVPRMATLLTKLLRLQIIHPFCLAWRISLFCKRVVELAASWISKGRFPLQAYRIVT